jgi:hypothetical protein
MTISKTYRAMLTVLLLINRQCYLLAGRLDTPAKAELGLRGDSMKPTIDTDRIVPMSLLTVGHAELNTRDPTAFGTISLPVGYPRQFELQDAMGAHVAATRDGA